MVHAYLVRLRVLFLEVTARIGLGVYMLMGAANIRSTLDPESGGGSSLCSASPTLSVATTVEWFQW
jgi:hypothetical protein